MPNRSVLSKNISRSAVLLMSATLLTACATVTTKPRLQIADQLVWSEAPTMTFTGLDPDQPYTLEVERRSFWNSSATERSTLVYTADREGMIDTSKQKAAGQDTLSVYSPIRDMAYLRDIALDDLDRGQLRVRLKTAAGDNVVSRTVLIDPDMSKIEETPLGDAFQGAYVLSSRKLSGPRPALVVLGGSEGGDSGSRSSAPIFAAEGYTVLGLPYYSPAWYGQTAQFPDLPPGFAEIPVDYLEKAVEELRKRPDVDADRITLMGGSKGAEFVLLAGSLIPDDSPGGGFCGIIGDVPSDVVWEGWGPGSEPGLTSSFSWRGEALPFVPYEDMSRALDREDPFTMTEAHENGRAANPDRLDAARIPVENIDEPILLIGGDQDTTWASGKMARTIAETRESAGLETELYVYPDASHGVGGNPLVRTKPANLEARLENFPATMAFIERVSQRNDCRG